MSNRWRQHAQEFPGALLVVVTQLEVWVLALRTTPLEGSQPVLALAAAASALPLLVRRRFPVAVAIGVAAVFSVQSLLLSPPDSPGRVAGLVLAAGTLGAYAELRRATVALVVVLLLLAADVDSVEDGLFIALLLTAPWFGGVLVRRYRLLALELERQREENARYAVLAERGRIAREMHDVLAHTLTTVAIQAQAAEQFLDRPEQARPWLEAIGTSVREAMRDVRLVVTALRDMDEEHGQQPRDRSEPSVPGLADLPGLVTAMDSPALAVTVALPDQLPSTSPTTGLAAYRIVQEALTNVRRHAGASRVSVEVTVDGDLVQVRVADDGCGRPDAVTEPGHGIRGMRERAELCHGELRAGPLPEGGFEVRARLPVASGAS